MISIPWPPRTYEGLTNTGKPNLLASSKPSSTFQTPLPFGLSIPNFSNRSSNFSLSSAISIWSAVVPKVLIPFSFKKLASLIAVCPPNCSITPSGFSLSIIFNTSSSVNGSKYNLSDILKSVLTVSGLLFTIIVSIPIFFNDFTQCTEA